MVHPAMILQSVVLIVRRFLKRVTTMASPIAASPAATVIIKKATNTELKEAAKKQNMITILEDGFIKAKQGITTIEEVLRVSKE